MHSLTPTQLRDLERKAQQASKVRTPPHLKSSSRTY